MFLVLPSAVCLLIMLVALAIPVREQLFGTEDFSKFVDTHCLKLNQLVVVRHVSDGPDLVLTEGRHSWMYQVLAGLFMCTHAQRLGRGGRRTQVTKFINTAFSTRQA